MIGKMTTEGVGSRGQISTGAAWLLIALGLFLFWLAVVVLLWTILSPGSQPNRMPPAVDAGIAASSERWTTLGDYYTALRAKAVADANSARYQALAGFYGANPLMNSSECYPCEDCVSLAATCNSSQNTSGRLETLLQNYCRDWPASHWKDLL